MDRTGTWLLGKLNDLRPEPGADPFRAANLAIATESIWTGSGMVFGMVMPSKLDARDELLAVATDLLNRWLPLLDNEEVLDRIATMARRTSLPVDTRRYVEAARIAKQRKDAAELEARLQKRDTARAVAESTEPRNVDLERAIDENPHDQAAYSVLADWLEAHGSPRGALIHMQLRGDPIDAYLRQHRDELLGNLDDKFDPGLHWTNGYVTSARFSSDDDLDADIEKLLQHPTGRRLYELRIGMMGESAADFSCTSIVELLAVQQPPALRSLFLGDFEYPDETELSWYEIGDISRLWDAVPLLETLTLRGVNFDLGTIDHEHLEDLEIQTTYLSPAQVDAIAVAQLPALERLVIWLGQSDVHEQVQQLLQRTDLPALRELGLVNTTLSDAICQDLISSPLLAKLERLDLSKGTLGDEGARAILDNADKFRHLEELNLSNSYISVGLIRELSRLGPTLVEEDMNDAADPDDRYITVSE